MQLDWLTILPYVGSFVLTFADASCKTFQQRNIASGKEAAAFVTSFPISMIGIANVSFVMMVGWWIMLSACLGGAIGVVAAMRLHKFIFKEKKNG